jgi:hypothetical protein
LPYWSLNSGPSSWVTPPALFLWRVFWERVSQTFVWASFKLWSSWSLHPEC